VAAGTSVWKRALSILPIHWAVDPSLTPGGRERVGRAGIAPGGVRWPANQTETGFDDLVSDAFPARTDKDGLWVLLQDASGAVNQATFAPISIPFSWFPERLPPGIPAVVVRGAAVGPLDNNVAIKDRPLTSDALHNDSTVAGKRTSSVVWGTNRLGNYSEFKAAGLHWNNVVALSPLLFDRRVGGPFHDGSDGNPGWGLMLNFTQATDGGQVGWDSQAGEGRFAVALGESAEKPIGSFRPGVFQPPGQSGGQAAVNYPAPAPGGSIIEIGHLSGGRRPNTTGRIPLKSNSGPVIADSVHCANHHHGAQLGSDGNTYIESAGHISTDALFKREGSTSYDAPKEYRDVYPVPFRGPYPIDVGIAPDYRSGHIWEGKRIEGLLRRFAWSLTLGPNDGTGWGDVPAESPPGDPPPGEPPGDGPPGNGDPTKPNPDRPDGEHDAMTPYPVAAPGQSFIGRPVGDNGEVVRGQFSPRAAMTDERKAAFNSWPATMRMTGIANRYPDGSAREQTPPFWMAKDLRKPAPGLLYFSPPEIQPDLPGVDTANEATGSKQTLGLHPKVVLSWGHIYSDSDDPHTMIREGWRLFFDESNGRLNIDYLDTAGSVDNTKDVYVNGSPIGGGSGDVVFSTSTTSTTVGTGSKTFTTAAALDVGIGTVLRIARDSPDQATFMEGPVTAISGTSVTVNVLITGGSGTHTDWEVYLGGGVVNVTATKPLESSGGSTPVISLEAPEEWASGRSYGPRKMVYVDTAGDSGREFYECMASHTSASTDHPALGTDRDVYWRRLEKQNRTYSITLTDTDVAPLNATVYASGTQIAVSIDTGAASFELADTVGTNGQYGDHYYVTLISSGGGTIDVGGLATLGAEGDGVHVKWNEDAGWYIEPGFRIQ
jgi:hypothetical protein